jgi:adenosylhomocysteine nucleosidase
MLRRLIVLASLGLTCCSAPEVPRPPRDAGSRVPAAAPFVVLVSANSEWRVVRAHEPAAVVHSSPWGEYFVVAVSLSGTPRDVVFFHGGWGKVAAAGSTQYCIDRWHPACLVNLGTCGGFKGLVERHEIILADRTIIYDIKEAMGDSAQAIRDYATSIDLRWLTAAPPAPVRRTLLVSGDRDLVPAEIPGLRAAYGAVAGDWESGAIAYVCARNGQRVLILRGVSDLVDEHGGEAYGQVAVFDEGTRVVMGRLLADLRKWLVVIARAPSDRRDDR